MRMDRTYHRKSIRMYKLILYSMFLSFYLIVNITIENNITFVLLGVKNTIFIEYCTIFLSEIKVWTVHFRRFVESLKQFVSHFDP